jgi:hypothetical protein
MSKQRYKVYGINFLANFPFRQLIPEKDETGESDLILQFHPPSAAQSPYIAQLAQPLPETGKDSIIFPIQEGHLLRAPHIGDFIIQSNRIDCYLASSELDPEYVENYILGSLFTIWFELHGFLVLHGSAIVYRDMAVAFLGRSGAGKSTLAATLVKAGLTHLTDDLFIVYKKNNLYFGKVGSPFLRLSDQALSFVDGQQKSIWSLQGIKAKKILPVGSSNYGIFQSGDCPLARIYFPTMTSTGPVSISALKPSEGLRQLLAFTFQPKVAAYLGQQGDRFNLLSDIAQKIPLRSLQYPRGMEHLPMVREAILADLA